MRNLISAGMSDYGIAARTGVPRATVQRWRRHGCPQAASARAERAAAWRAADARAYCYLLGLYLGDGWIAHRPPATWTLRIACDEQYPGIINEAITAMESVFPGASATRHRRAVSACEVVSIVDPAIGVAFPQHGPGRKHDRDIALHDWQLALTAAHPEALVRGLIQSDGCRCLNRVRTTLPSGRHAEYTYVRYFFSNLSQDIREIFRSHCALLGVCVTQPNHRNLAISKRASVAILEQIVGPKT